MYSSWAAGSSKATRISIHVSLIDEHFILPTLSAIVALREPHAFQTWHSVIASQEGDTETIVMIVDTLVLPYAWGTMCQSIPCPFIAGAYLFPPLFKLPKCRAQARAPIGWTVLSPIGKAKAQTPFHPARPAHPESLSPMAARVTDRHLHWRSRQHAIRLTGRGGVGYLTNSRAPHGRALAHFYLRSHP